jgi:hypothetical protein
MLSVGSETDTEEVKMVLSNYKVGAVAQAYLTRRLFTGVPSGGLQES